MNLDQSYLNSTDTGETFNMGGHGGIPSPTYIPEVKGAEGLRAILDHTDALEANNPIMVPAAKWSHLRERNVIRTRTNSEGEEIGEDEIEELEENHPLVYYDPPELYNYRLTKTLVNYLFKHGAWNKERFEESLKEGEHSEALKQLPEFAHPFVHANINRVLEETEGASRVSPDDLKINSTDQAWTALEAENFDEYYQVLAAQAAERPSSVVVPPVPQLSHEWDEDLVEAWRTSNSKMAEQTDGKEACDTYCHLYIDYQALDAEASEDTASQALKVLDRELDESQYAGIALTVHQPNRIWQTNRAARMQTFVEDLSQIGTEHELPIICPRSEWFGSYVTDLGIQAFSSLLNGAWQYSRYSSGGGPTGADKYGSTMIPNEARALKLKSDDREDLEGYLEANDSLPDVDGLPSVPPTYDSSGSNIKAKFGTSPKFRRTFGKPRRLAHIEEARIFREKRADGADTPAREYLKESKNPYIEI